MSHVKSILVAAIVCVAALFTLSPAVSAQDYGPTAPPATAPAVTEAPAPAPPVVETTEATTDVSVLSNSTPEVAAPEVGANQLPVTGSTVFPLVASGVGLVALGLVFRQADRIGKDEE